MELLATRAIKFNEARTTWGQSGDIAIHFTVKTDY